MTDAPPPAGQPPQYPPPAPGWVPPPAPPGYAPPPPAPPGYAPPPPGYASPPAGYAPPPVGYAPPPAAPYPSGYPAPPPRPSNGVLPWALGFLVFFPIPFLGALAAAIAMAVPYRSVAARGRVAEANARSAANWGITFGLVSTLLIVAHFVLLGVLSQDGPISGFYPFGTIITVYGGVILLHIVLVIVGTVRASKGMVVRVPFAIPYIRAPRAQE